MSTAEKVNAEVMVGTWSQYTCQISEQAQQAFNEALKPIVGVHYTPVAECHQMVNGENYRFFCTSKAVTLQPANGDAIVYIHKPLNGIAVLKSITSTSFYKVSE